MFLVTIVLWLIVIAFIIWMLLVNLVGISLAVRFIKYLWDSIKPKKEK